VNQKLALNLGLRYELEGGISERFNRQVGRMDPSRVLPITSAPRPPTPRSPSPAARPPSTSSEASATWEPKAARTR